VASRRQRAIDIVLWVFALFLAWVFIRQGYAKFSDSSGWARAFRTWHFPAWFRVLIGIGETTAAVLLLASIDSTGALITSSRSSGRGTHSSVNRPASDMCWCPSASIRW